MPAKSREGGGDAELGCGVLELGAPLHTGKKDLTLPSNVMLGNHPQNVSYLGGAAAAEETSV